MGFFVVLGYLISIGVIVHLLLSGKRPAATLAWIWAILLFPFAGALIYIIFGADRIKRRRLRYAARRAPERTATHEKLNAMLRDVSETLPVLSTLARINQIPTSSACSVKVLVDARNFYPALLKRIEEARHHIHVEFFIWHDDVEGRRFRDALVAAARRGVAVRLLLDQMGCFSLKAAFFDSLVEAGGKFSWFYSLPFNRRMRFLNLRNHRKLQIIDGQIGFVGGMNMGDEHSGRSNWPALWRDVQVEVSGPVVSLMQEVFATDWYFATEESLPREGYFPEPERTGDSLCQVLAGGPDLPREPVPKSIITLLNSASKRVWISTGYFVPDVQLLTALQICGARGVDVRLIVSEVTDHRYLLEVGRSFYEELLEFGVRIFEYSQGLNHAKTILFDDDWFSIGSANFDNRSMRLNFELNLFLRCPAEARVLEEMMEQDFALSREISAEEIRNQSFLRRLGKAALRPLAPLL